MLLASGADAQVLDEQLVPDEALRGAIRMALDTAGLPHTLAGVASIEALNASGRGIVRVEGLQHARGLQSLDLSRNEITEA